MKYYIDCEFDNQGAASPLLSMAIVSYTGKALYLTTEYAKHGIIHDAWVRENVMPILLAVPGIAITRVAVGATKPAIAELLEQFFEDDLYPYVIADWPVDLEYLCHLMITGPGTMIDVPRMEFAVERVDAYPTALVGAMQHNAYWDAMALRHMLMTAEGAKP